MSLIRIVIPAVTFILLFFILSTEKSESLTKNQLEFINGVSFVAPSRELTNDPFPPLKMINANWIAVMPYAFVNEEIAEVIFDHGKQWWGEQSTGVIGTIVLAKEQHFNIMLKPHVWVRGQGWTGDFQLDNEVDWEKWESSYTSYILNHARIADSLDVEAFCIGLEFRNVVRERPQFWVGLIEEVRAVYHGQITYAANWDNYQNVTFWQDLDFIGIDAYFPVSQNETPSVREMKKSWQKEKEQLMAFSEKYGKPIVFTEYGYRSIDKTAGNQWELVHHRRYEGLPNFEAQENAYKALFESFWEEPWFYGGFLWKWYPYDQDKIDPDNSDYTPQKKPVEKVIKEWYKKR